jgi:hypothetical protein
MQSTDITTIRGADLMKTGLDLSQSFDPMLSIPLLGNSRKLAVATVLLQAQAIRAMMRYQIEAFGFLKHRFEQDVKLIDELSESGEYNDAFDVFATFMQNAATEYATEASKVMSISSKLASETAERVRREAEEAVEDIAVAATA